VNNSQEIKDAFEAFCKLIEALRTPETGCPWDLEQDHKSLRSFMIEEAYEAADALGGDNADEKADELGDVLLQVVLNAQVAKDEGSFDILDVINKITAKMIRRHPHVFGNEQERSERSIAEVKTKWQEIKNLERGSKPKEKGIFHAAKKVNPSTTQSLKIGKIASQNNFDWDDPREVLDQLISEMEEVKEAFEDVKTNKAHVIEELGDVYFTVSQLCRHLGADPEVVSRDANFKFLGRFEKVEKIAQSKGVEVKNASKKELESFWNEAKKIQ